MKFCFLLPIIALLFTSTNFFGQDAVSSVGEPRADHFTFITGIHVYERKNQEKLEFYPLDVISQVRNKWYPQIPDLQKSPGHQPSSALIEFEIKKDGSLDKVRKIESAGDTSLDAAALSALTASAPFPHLPNDYPEKTFKLQMRFSYYQTENPETPFCVDPGSEPHADGNTVYRAGKEVSVPHAIYSPEPEYSEEARKASYMSIVNVAGTVDTRGTFTDLCVMQGAEFGLNEKAMQTIKTWKFEPATLQGKPVPVRIVVELSFRLF